MAALEPLTLYQLLREQQEPFILHIYLSERGRPEKRMNSPNSFSCYHWISMKSIKRSARCMLNRSKEDIPWCLKMIAAVYNQLIPLKARPKIKTFNHKDRRCITMQTAPDIVEECDGFNTASSRIIESYSIQHGVENTTASLQRHPRSLTANNFQPTGVCSQREKQDRISKTGWQHTNKLMLDLVEEFVQTQSRSGTQKHHQEGYLESEELGKIITEKIKMWTKKFGYASNSIRLQASDFCHSGEDYKSHDQEQKEIGLEIMDAILEEINAEFVTEMTSFCHEQIISTF